MIINFSICASFVVVLARDIFRCAQCPVHAMKNIIFVCHKFLVRTIYLALAHSSSMACEQCCECCSRGWKNHSDNRAQWHHTDAIKKEKKNEYKIFSLLLASRLSIVAVWCHKKLWVFHNLIIKVQGNVEMCWASSQFFRRQENSRSLKMYCKRTSHFRHRRHKISIFTKNKFSHEFPLPPPLLLFRLFCSCRVCP